MRAKWQMWRVFRVVDGVMEMDPRAFGTQVEAQQRARELNAKGKKGEGDK